MGALYTAASTTDSSKQIDKKKIERNRVVGRLFIACQLISDDFYEILFRVCAQQLEVSCANLS